MSGTKKFKSVFQHTVNSKPAAFAMPTSVNIFDSHTYLNCLQTYYVYFGTVPGIKMIHSTDHEKAIKWVEARFAGTIMDRHCKEMYDTDKKSMEVENVLYILDEKIIVDIEDNGCVCIVYESGDEEQATQIADEMKKFIRKPRKEQFVNVIINSIHGLGLSKIKCPRPRMALNEHYNDDLQGVHKEVIKSLSAKDKSGLLLFYGVPGTGKSTYLRYLVGSIKKDFIFLSPKIASNLDAPNFINLLLENRNSVLIIEDAEELLVSRELGNNSAISILLNLTDGLLGESLGIQIICTFNTELQNIDTALLRKGRLKAMYEFKELAAHKANALLERCGVYKKVSNPMTLAEIYNVGKDGFKPVNKKQKIGFMVA